MNRLAGEIRETPTGMEFQYSSDWLGSEANLSIGLTLPKRGQPYVWQGPSPFFMGLLPEGWLHALALGKLKIQADDWFGQISNLCTDCIGAVHVEAATDV